MSEMPRTWDVEVLVPLNYRVQADDIEDAEREAKRRVLAKAPPLVVGFPERITVREVGQSDREVSDAD